jgi:signal transduction histidine kinase
MAIQTASLTRTFRRNIVIFTFLAMAIFAYFWIARELQRFKEESLTLRTNYLELQKTMLQDVVTQAVDYIYYNNTLTEKRLKESIKARVDEAYSVALNLYNEHTGKKEAAEIQKIIKDALRPIRFNHGRGYYFATNLNGIEELFADRPDMEGKNLLDLQDTQGRFVIKEMIVIARQFGEGFYQYTWTKPNTQGKDFPKIAFIKRFEPYDWLIGTGEYLDDVQADIQQEVIERLVAVRFGKEGYLFASTFTGEPLFTNGQITLHTQNLWDLTDPNGNGWSAQACMLMRLNR